MVREEIGDAVIVVLDSEESVAARDVLLQDTARRVSRLRGEDASAPSLNLLTTESGGARRQSLTFALTHAAKEKLRERGKSALGNPEVVVTGASSVPVFLFLEHPIVYCLFDGDVPLYVGVSSTGLNRPISTHHQRRLVQRLAENDNTSLWVWTYPSHPYALVVERALIEAWRPAENQAGNPNWFTSKRGMRAERSTYRDIKRRTTTEKKPLP